MKQWQAVDGNFDEIFAGTSRGFFFVDVKYGTAAGATEKVNIQSYLSNRKSDIIPFETEIEKRLMKPWRLLLAT